jgi:hypothetical protein
MKMSEIPWDIILPNLGWVVTLITLIGLGYKMGRWTKGIEERFKKIEENPIIVATNKLSAKIVSDLLYQNFEKNLKTNPLTAEEIRLRRELTEKLDSRSITPDEARILHSILNKELEEARATGNILAVLAILFLIGLVIAILSD